MALITHEYCYACENVTHHNHGQCTPCADRRKREETAKWNAMTTDEKLQDLRKRLEKVERGPERYA